MIDSRIMADEQEIVSDERLKTDIDTPSDVSAVPAPKTETDESPKTGTDAEPEVHDGGETQPQAGCPTELGFSGSPRCGRRLHLAPDGVDEWPVCLMHSQDGCKKSGPLFDEFWVEFERILEEAGEGVACFDGFVFPELFFPNRKFKAICQFNGAIFTQGAVFDRSTFEHEVQFLEATFVQEATFIEATFMEKVQFPNAIFKKRADFFGTRFMQVAVFFGATFNESASFHSGTFTQGAIFNVATFTRYANFSLAAFARSADFNDVTFSLDAIFEGTKFGGGADWRECRFLGKAKFRRTEFNSENEVTPSSVFSLAIFDTPDDVVFDHVDLSRTLFVNCDVSEFWFTSSVLWAKRKGNRGLAVFEEIILIDPKFSEVQKRYGPIDHGAVEQIYHQLKKNYDARLDYRKANEFHFGEMEMRRLESPNDSAFLKPWRWLRPWLGPEAWYRRASDYGNSYMKPILWLFATLFVAAALFPIPGLETKLPKPEPATTYQGAWNKQDTWTNNRWTEAKLIDNSYIAAVDTATFQRNPEHVPSYPWGRILEIVETLLTSTLFGLFLLAIRRQFRR
jgi:uncharacterized protein YjbI with pentapeptide repeats